MADNRDYVNYIHLHAQTIPIPELMGPDGELIRVVTRVSHPSLIELRTGFEPEIQKTMEDL